VRYVKQSSTRLANASTEEILMLHCAGIRIVFHPLHEAAEIEIACTHEVLGGGNLRSWMASAHQNCFLRLGFDVSHVPGISRAWQCELTAGAYVLVTDIGGYDLPQHGGPYSAILISAADEIVELESWLPNLKGLLEWLRHAQRLMSRGSPLQQRSTTVASRMQRDMFCARNAGYSGGALD
jgi:hypothetical protein